MTISPRTSSMWDVWNDREGVRLASLARTEEIGLISPHLDEFNPPNRGLWLAGAIFAHNICRVQNPEFASLAARSLPPSSLLIPSIQPFDPTFAGHCPSIPRPCRRRDHTDPNERTFSFPPAKRAFFVSIPDPPRFPISCCNLGIRSRRSRARSVRSRASGCRAAGRVGAGPPTCLPPAQLIHTVS
jgi:hypothetical protein